MINTIARPMAKTLLYIAAKIMKPIRIRLPRVVSNKLTNRLGTANITIHNTTNKVIRPTIKFKLWRETILDNMDILYIILI